MECGINIGKRSAGILVIINYRIPGSSCRNLDAEANYLEADSGNGRWNIINLAMPDCGRNAGKTPANK